MKITLRKTVEILIYCYILILMSAVSSGALSVKIIRVLLLGAGVFYFLREEHGRLKRSFYYRWAVLFLIYNVLLWNFAYDKKYAMEYTMTVFYILVINVIIAIYLRKNNIVRKMTIAFLFGTLLKAIITFGKNGLLVYMTARRSTEGSANTLGFYAAISVVFCIFYWLQDKKRNGKYVLASLVYSGIVILSASRKAILFAVVPLTVYLIMNNRNPVKTFRNILLVCVMFVGGYWAIMNVPGLYTMIGHRVQTMLAGLTGDTTDASTQTRIRLIQAGINWFRNKPFFGYGLSNFKALNITYNNNEYYAHNNYVELLVDCGLVGTILYYMLYLKSLLLLWNNVSLNRSVRNISIGLIAALLIGDYGLVSYNLPVFQLVLLVIFIISEYSREIHEDKKSII